MIRIGLFGGTFDPFTPAHLAIAEGLLTERLVDRVVVMPSVVSYHRPGKEPMFSNGERLKILHTALDGLSNVEVDGYEYGVSGEMTSRRYIDMLTDVKHRWESRTIEDVEWHTVIGGDSLKAFKTWHRWEDILKESKLIAVARDGEALECDPDVKFSELKIPGYLASVSATEIRNRLKSLQGVDRSDIVDRYIDDTFESDSTSAEISRRVNAIANVLADPYKDDICAYSLIEDIVRGKA